MKKLLAIAVLVALGMLWLSLQAPKDTSQSLPDLPAFALSDVASLRIKQGEQVVLDAVYEGDVWRTREDKPVALQTLAIEQLLHDLQSMKPKRVVSRKTERFPTFEVNTYRVVLKDSSGKVLLDVFVGKPATDLTSTYIRLADSPVVLTVDKVLTWQVRRTHDAWLKPADTPKDKASET